MFFKKSSKKVFSNRFLLIVLALIIFCFIALFIYQRFFDKQKEINQIGNQQSVTDSMAQEIKEENPVDWQNIKLELTEVPAIEKNDHLLGKVGAPNELIVYSDFTDPLAASFLPIVEEFKNRLGEQVVIAWRQHPLANNPWAKSIAIATECAGRQGKFWPFASKIAAMASQEKPLDDALVVAKEIGLDEKAFQKCLTKSEVQATIDKQSAEAEALGAIGVPSSFLNKKVISGVYPLDDFVDENGQTQPGLLKMINSQK
ncbi:MAG TPA: thioredoxin domain-containing protein [bacterium]|nr:thioredoxin domain-containing protein [bacterium]